MNDMGNSANLQGLAKASRHGIQSTRANVRTAVVAKGQKQASEKASKIDVLIISRHYAPEPIGSAPPMQQMAEWLSRFGLRIRVVTSRPSYPHAQITPGYETGAFDETVENGVSVTRYPTMPSNGGGLLRRAVPEGRFMLQLLYARAVKRFPTTNSVISLCPSILTVIAALLFRDKRGKHIAVVHDIQSGLGSSLGSRAVKPIMWLLRRIEAWTLNRVDHIVVLSQAMATEIKALRVSTPITILPPQVDCAEIYPMPAPVNRAQVLMYSGNIGRKQGIEQIMDMALILRDRAPSVNIQIRGDGARRDLITQRLATGELPNVTLLPLVDRSDVCKSFSEANVHLVPQLAEGGDFAVPSKAFAIMAAGRPFVTTATTESSIGQLAEASGAFVCVPPNDPAALADAVLSLLEDPALCAELGRRGREYALAHADTPVVMESVLRLLTTSGSEMLAAHNGGAPMASGSR